MSADFNLLSAYRVMYAYALSMSPETATEVAEAYAIGQGHDEWLDDETHQVWDVACDALQNANDDMDAASVAGYEEHA